MPTPDPDDAVRVAASPLYVKRIPEHLVPAPLPLGGHHVEYKPAEKAPAPTGFPAAGAGVPALSASVAASLAADRARVMRTARKPAIDAAMAKTLRDGLDTAKAASLAAKTPPATSAR